MSWLASSRRCAAIACLLLAACGSDPDVVPNPGVGNGNLGDSGATPVDAGTLPVFPEAGSIGTDGAVVTYDDAGGCAAVKQQTEAKKAPADIVWILDNSGSMFLHIAKVAEEMNEFIANSTKAGADIGVTVITTAAPTIFGGTSSPNFHPVDQDVQSHDAFQKLLDHYGKYSSFLRAGAPKHFVVVTDDGNLMPGPEFITKMEAKLGSKFTFHSITAELAKGCPTIGQLSPAPYLAAAQATGGEQLSLCGDWGMGMQKIQANVVGSLPLPCDYTIPPPPNGQMLDVNAVTVRYTPGGGAEQEIGLATSIDKCGDNVAWHFDDTTTPTKVIMCPKACELVKNGGGISIGFGCAPTIIF